MTDDTKAPTPAELREIVAHNTQANAEFQPITLSAEKWLALAAHLEALEANAPRAEYERGYVVGWDAAEKLYASDRVDCASCGLHGPREMMADYTWCPAPEVHGYHCGACIFKVMVTPNAADQEWAARQARAVVSAQIAEAPGRPDEGNQSTTAENCGKHLAGPEMEITPSESNSDRPAEGTSGAVHVGGSIPKGELLLLRKDADGNPWQYQDGEWQAAAPDNEPDAFDGIMEDRARRRAGTAGSGWYHKDPIPRVVTKSVPEMMAEHDAKQDWRDTAEGEYVLSGKLFDAMQARVDTAATLQREAERGLERMKRDLGANLWAEELARGLVAAGEAEYGPPARVDAVHVDENISYRDNNPISEAKSTTSHGRPTPTPASLLRDWHRETE